MRHAIVEAPLVTQTRQEQVKRRKIKGKKSNSTSITKLQGMGADGVGHVPRGKANRSCQVLPGESSRNTTQNLKAEIKFKQGGKTRSLVVIKVSNLTSKAAGNGGGGSWLWPLEKRPKASDLLGEKPVALCRGGSLNPFFEKKGYEHLLPQGWTAAQKKGGKGASSRPSYELKRSPSTKTWSRLTLFELPKKKSPTLQNGRKKTQIRPGDLKPGQEGIQKGSSLKQGPAGESPCKSFPNLLMVDEIKLPSGGKTDRGSNIKGT